MITLDMDLILELNKLHVNVSDECNQHLWTLITKQQSVTKQNKDLSAEIEKLTTEKQEIDKELAQKANREKAGITDKMLKFLKAMNTNIMCAKDNKKAWLKLTGQEIGWDELKHLKIVWA